jgi:hypothetical protein
MMPQTEKLRARRKLAVAILGAIFLLGEGAPGAFASETVPFEDIGGDQCYMFSDLLRYKTEGNNTTELPLEFVINDEGDYQKLFDPKIMRQSCINGEVSKTIDAVDFLKQTVLGLWDSGSCAAAGFKKTVLKDNIKNTIIYSVAVIESMMSCSGPGLESLNLIAIPKIPVGYKVIFEKVHE